VLPVYARDSLWIVIELIGDMPVFPLIVEGENGIALLDCLRQLTVPEMCGRGYHARNKERFIVRPLSDLQCLFCQWHRLPYTASDQIVDPQPP
jgi:hypothetical protein